MLKLSTHINFALFVLFFAVFPHVAQANSPWVYRTVVVNGGDTTQINAHPIADSSKAHIGYHNARPEAPQLWFGFDGYYADKITVRMGVPVLDRFRLLRPKAALVAPGLPQPEEPVPFRLPPGYGAVIYDTAMLDVSSRTESFTGTQSWVFESGSFFLPQEGRAYLVGYVPGGGAGKFWMTVGTDRQFRFADMFTILKRTAQIRAFHEMSPGLGVSFWQTLILMGFAILGTILAVLPS